jgi:hypothetical protein
MANSSPSGFAIILGAHSLLTALIYGNSVSATRHSSFLPRTIHISVPKSEWFKIVIKVFRAL